MQRFIEAQETTYQQALEEIRLGRKRSHWMWFVFPQVQGLGFSEASRYYAIRDLQEAAAYLKHPVLGARLVEISKALLDVQNPSAAAIFGSPDDMKLKSSMTLFAAVAGSDQVFQSVLDRYFKGAKDQQTLKILEKL